MRLRERDRARRRAVLGRAGRGIGEVSGGCCVVGVGRRRVGRGVGRDRLDLWWSVITSEEDAPDERCDQSKRQQGHKAADNQAATPLAAVDHDFLTDLLLTGFDPTLLEFGL